MSFPSDFLWGASISAFQAEGAKLEDGIKLAIGSSSKNTMLILKQIGLDTFFDAVADGTMIEYSKPHPQIFMLAVQKLGLDFKKCLVVEDAIAGCISAKSASMKVAAISSAYSSVFADYHLNILKIY